MMAPGEGIMAQRPKRGRPAVVVVGDVRARATRGPREDGRWYWRAEYHTERATVWTGWGTRAEVQRRLTEHVAEHGTAARPSARAEELATLDDLMRAWFAHLEDDCPDLKPASLRTYRGCVRRLRVVAAKVACERLPTGAGIEVRAALIRRYAPATVQTTIVALNAAWKWARGRGLVPDVPLDVPGVKVPEPEHVTPSDDVLRRVLDRIDSPRWRVAVEVLFITGARPVDLSRATRLEDGGIVLDGKTGQRWVPLPPELYRALAELQLSHGRGTVLPWTEDFFRVELGRKLRDAAEVAGVNARALRRACSDRLLRSGVEIAVYAYWMGHGPAVALRYYRRATRDDLRLAAEAVAKGRRGGRS